MVRSKTSTTFEAKNGKFVLEGTQDVTIPDEALSYIVSNFLQEKNRGDSPIVVGVSSHTVEAVLQLLVDWAAANGYVRNGIMTIGGHKID